ncbi:hypothetical protein Tco_1239216 [Tanacetum coccineum]
MLLCKQVEKGVPLSAYQGDWLDDTDEEPNEQELEAHCLYMTKIQEVSTAESGPTFDAEPLEKVHTDNEYNVFDNDQEHNDQPKNMNDIPLMEMIDSNTTLDSLDVCDNDFKDDQNANDQEDERVALAESNDIRNRCRSALYNQEIELEKYKKYKDSQIEKEELEQKNVELVHPSSLEHIRYDRLRKEMEQLQEDFKIREDKDINKVIALENQIKPTFANPKYLKKAQSEKPCLYTVPLDKDDLANIFAPDSAETIILEQESRSRLNKDKVKAYDYSNQNSLYEFFLRDICACKNLLIPLAKKTKENVYAFESALKKEMFEDSDSMANIDEYSEMACKYMEKITECECLENELFKQKENVSKEVYIELL